VPRSLLEWSQLVDTEGPPLAWKVLRAAFPQGFAAHDPAIAEAMRREHAAWEDAVAEATQAAAADVQRKWSTFVLESILDFGPQEVVGDAATLEQYRWQVAEYGTVLTPTYVVKPTVSDIPRLLVQIHPHKTRLTAASRADVWKASPAARMTAHLRGVGVKLGLVSDGEQWMIIHAPVGESASWITWYASLWREEPVSVRSFRSLIGRERLVGVPESESLEALFVSSRDEIEDVTDRLGLQLRRAVEVLVRAIDRIDQDQGRRLLERVTEKDLYEAAVTIMMRLVFLLYAEERGMLPADNDLYSGTYAMGPLRERLREAADLHGEETLERRCDAWCQMLATFRAVYGGVRCGGLDLPAYGGGLFDPDRHPFLEGRPVGSDWREHAARPLPISNRTVLHILEAIQVLGAGKRSGGKTEAVRLSFKALDIEQIGHVYEGLLDHTVIRTREPLLGLLGSGEREPEVPISELEATANDRARLIELLRERTGKTQGSLVKAIEAEPAYDERLLRLACGNDEELQARVVPFLSLVRADEVGYPVIIPKGSVCVTEGRSRRATGTHYTPRSLTEEVVNFALEPLLFDGPAEGKPRAEWRLKSPEEILSLRVVDPACGSGAFLVQACRHMAQHLVQAWGERERTTAEDLRLPDAKPLSDAGGASKDKPLPREEYQRLIAAQRAIASGCLYGVDKDPLAVEMAKLSLWLITLDPGKPFTFLDHALRCGDSLLGVTDLAQVESFHIDPSAGERLHKDLWKHASFFKDVVRRAVELRREIARTTIMTAAESETLERRLSESDDATALLRVIGDIVIGAALAAKSDATHEEELQAFAYEVASLLRGKPDAEVLRRKVAEWRQRAQRLLDVDLPEGSLPRRPFHWTLEFPEVFGEREGFDAAIGNPPFQGGKKISGALGAAYRDFLVVHTAGGARGSADLCAYFLLRMFGNVRAGGEVAMLATNTIAQGETREVGLGQIESNGGAIFRAVSSRRWPGKAVLEISQVWLRKGGWDASATLDGNEVPKISSQLVKAGAVDGHPFGLKANESVSHVGVYVLGNGFILSPEEAQNLIALDSRNAAVLFPYMNGDDLNGTPDLSASRWIINFQNWPLDRETAPDGYDGYVATDFQACLEIVRKRVKPDRDRLLSGGASARDIGRRWWQFARPKSSLYASIRDLPQVLVISLTGKHFTFALLDTRTIFDQTLIVFSRSGSGWLAAYSSAIHLVWAIRRGSTLKADPRYNPVECSETFPWPLGVEIGLADIGQAIHTLRSRLCLAADLGLTKLYNHFHDSKKNEPALHSLRALHTQLDRAVADAYGWTDLKLDHGFHQTKHGERFTVSDVARNQILDRLLALNHERYAEEVRQGLHEPKSGKKIAASKGKKGAPTAPPSPLFGDQG
jgi:hypothetical protein